MTEYRLHWSLEWEAHAYCPSCGGGIDLYVEEFTDPNAGKYLECRQTVE